MVMAKEEEERAAREEKVVGAKTGRAVMVGDGTGVAVVGGQGTIGAGGADGGGTAAREMVARVVFSLMGALRSAARLMGVVESTEFLLPVALWQVQHSPMFLSSREVRGSRQIVDLQEVVVVKRGR
jgi:hypothetical protein